MLSTIRNQLLFFGAMAAALIVLLTAIGASSVRQIERALHSEAASAITMRNHMQGDMMHDALRADILAAQLATRNGDTAALAAAAAQVDEHYTEFNKTIQANLNGTHTEAVMATLKELAPAVKQYGENAASIVREFAKSGSAADARVPQFMDQFKQLEESQAEARDLIESEIRLLADASSKASHSAYIQLAATAAITLILMAGVGMWIFRRVTQPLGVLRSVVDRVNGGDMQVRAGLTRKDELGAFGEAFDRLLDERIAHLNQTALENDQLNHSVIAVLQAVSQLSQRDLTVKAPVTDDVIGTVSDSINALTAATSTVLSGVHRIAGDVATVSERVRSQGALVTTSAEHARVDVVQMVQLLSSATETMKQVAVLADQSNRSAERATVATDTALATVNSTVSGMLNIRDIISETEKRIKRLGERSMEINGIVNLIGTISERTHVLALNASMQAAVAGEAGRGFAVVAEEVQRLAESSRGATQQIGTLVHNIQVETSEAIATVNRTIDQVVQGSEQAQKAGEQMRVTQQITTDLVENVKRIADASVRQEGMSTELLEAVQRIGLSNARTSQQIDAQNTETNTLQDAARRLVESVSVFRLPQSA